MDDTIVSSIRNPRVKYVRKLHKRKYRLSEQALLLEGVRLVDDAWRARIYPRQLIFAPDLIRTNQRALALLDELRAHQIDTLAVTTEVFVAVAGTVTPQGLAAVVPLPKLEFPVDSRMLLLLDQIRDPGNAGTLLRSAEAAGAGGVIFCPDTVDPFNDKVIRAAMGAHFRIPIRICDTWDAVRKLTPAGHALYLADSAGTLAYDEVDWTKPAVLVVGGETSGASQQGRNLATPIAIPMLGRTESLNAGVAGSIILFEAARQRRGPV